MSLGNHHVPEDDRRGQQYERDLTLIARAMKSVVRIRFKRSITEGWSGSVVLLVDVEPEKRATRLREMMKEALSEVELKEVCFDVGYDYADLGGDNKRVNISNLIEQCERDQRLEQLADRVKRLDKPQNVDLEPWVEPQGTHYLKIHSNDRDVAATQRFIKSAHHIPHSPRIVDYGVYEDRLAVLYEPAHDIIGPTNVSSLTALLTDDRELADIQIKGLIDIWRDWANGEQSSQIRMVDPHELLTRMLGLKRTRGEDRVQKRVEHTLGVTDQPLRLTFGADTCPNPLAFLSDPSLWAGQHDELLAVPIGIAHGDCHSGNIICLRHEPKEKPNRPEIIDFGEDHSLSQCVFFDPVYLEFDFLIQLYRSDNGKARQELTKVIPYLFSSVELAGNAPGGGQAFNLVKLIRPLREFVQGFYRGREQDIRTAFWLTAVAVGLNYARKRTVTDPQIRLIALYYAAAALKKALDGLGIAYSTGDAYDMHFLDWPGAVEIEGAAQSNKPEDAALQVARVLQQGSEPVLFVCGPEVAGIASDDLFEDLRRRLAWTDYPDWTGDTGIEEIRTLGDALAAYRQYATPLNLKKAIKRRLREQPLLPLLAVLGRYPQARVAILDWDDRLDLAMRRWSGGSPDGHVLHLCGSLASPEAMKRISWVDAQPAEDTDDCAALRRGLKQYRVVFLDGTLFEYDLWRRFVEISLEDRELGWGVWQTLPGGQVQQERPGLARVHAVSAGPEDFLRQVLSYLEPGLDPDHPPEVQPARCTVEEYEPEPVDLDWVPKWVTAQIIKGKHQRWVLYGEPGSGMSVALRKMARVHSDFEREEAAKAGCENDLPYAAIIDFAAEPEMIHKKWAVLHLLYDRFNCSIPDMPSQLSREPDADYRVDFLLQDFLSAKRFGANPYHKRTLLFCFDSLYRVVNDDMLYWLRNDLIAGLIKKWNQKSAKQRGLPTAKVVMTLRWGSMEKPPSQQLIRREWPGFEFTALRPYVLGDIENLITRYVENVTGLDQYEMGMNDWREDQAQQYKSVARDNMQAIAALIKEHARMEFPDPGDWPGPEIQPDIYSRVILPAVWRSVECALDYDEGDEDNGAHRPVPPEVLLCRRLHPSLLAAIRDSRIVGPIQPIQLRNDLRDARLIYPDAPGSDWYTVIPTLHNILHDIYNHTVDAVERQRFLDILRLAYDNASAIAAENVAVFSMWKGAIVDAMYYYARLYARLGTGEGAFKEEPGDRLRGELDRYFKVNPQNKAQRRETLAELRAEAESVPLEDELLQILGSYS